MYSLILEREVLDEFSFVVTLDGLLQEYFQSTTIMIEEKILIPQRSFMAQLGGDLGFVI